MKKRIHTDMFSSRALVLLFAVVSVLTVTNACSEQASEEQSQAGSVDSQQLQQEWAEAADALKHYSAAKRDQAIAEAKQTLDAMDTRIDRLESRIQEEWNQLSQDARQRRESALRTLRQERNELAEWYGGMKHSSTDAWESVKQGFVDAYATLSDSFSEAQAEFDSTEETPQQ